MSGIIAQNTLDNSGLIKSPAGGGAWNFIAKQTASASADISFTSGIDSTYKEYVFTFNNMHPASSGVDFSVGFRDGETDYDAVKTTTSFYALHNESGTPSGLTYSTGTDLAQSTAFEQLGADTGNDNDQCHSGYMHLFNPSSDVFVKHFISVGNSYHADDYMQNHYHAGYINTVTAIDGVQFKFSSGNIDAGDICLYGITT